MAKVQGHGQGNNKISEDLREELFWSKVDKKDLHECWPYKEFKDSKGYGKFWNGEMKMYANRMAWEYHYKQKVPKGMLICHSCNNPICCNPMHLYCGTYSDNLNDSLKEGGVRIKFYAGEIWLIRRLKIITGNIGLRPRYKFTARHVAKMFKTCKTTILNIWNSEKYLCKEGYYI